LAARGNVCCGTCGLACGTDEAGCGSSRSPAHQPTPPARLPMSPTRFPYRLRLSCAPGQVLEPPTSATGPAGPAPGVPSAVQHGRLRREGSRGSTPAQSAVSSSSSGSIASSRGQSSVGVLGPAGVRQSCQGAPHPLEFGELVVEPGDRIASTPLCRGASGPRSDPQAQQRFDLFQGESESLRPLDELDPSDGVRRILSIASWSAWRWWKESPPLVIPHGVQPYPRPSRHLSNREHGLTLHLFG